MVHHKDAMWRIEFRTDLTRSDAQSLPLAYMLEAHWEDGVRWLGMLFRKRLTPLELERVNLATWRELEGVEAFMKELFDEAWTAAAAPAAAEIVLGSHAVAAKYPVQSALHFGSTPNEFAFGDDDPVNSFQGLYAHLLGMRNRLTPTLIAPVVTLPTRRRPAARIERPDLEIANRAA